LCPVLGSLSLDFETPATGSVQDIPTSFGKVSLVGYYESSNIDSDLVAADPNSHTVLQSSPNSSSTGVGQIILDGALGTSVNFFYGAKAESNHSDTVGGFTGYTYTQTQVENGWQPEPSDVFKQFALNQGQPIGSQLLDGPTYGPVNVDVYDLQQGKVITYAVPADGPGYFNEFRWTSGTKAGDVFAIRRSGAIQIDNVLLTYEPALDLLKDSVRPVVSGGTIVAQFAPIGSAGPNGQSPVPLKDLAQALGVDHFNWRQSVLALPTGVTKAVTFRNVNTAQHLSDVINQRQFAGGNLPTPAITGTAAQAYYSDGSPIDMVPLTTNFLDPIVSRTGQAQTQFYAFYTPKGWVPIVLDDLHGNYLPADSSDCYLGEVPGQDDYWQNYRLDASDQPSKFSLYFSDEPSAPAGTFSGAYPYFKFRTELVGVKSDGSLVSWHGMGTNFIWKTNGVNAAATYLFSQPFKGTGPSITSGGVYDVFTDDDSAPNAPPVAADDMAGVHEGGSVDIPVLQNDDNPDFGSLDPSSVRITQLPANGGVAIDPTTGVVTYTANAGFLGTDTFRYTVKDDKGAVSNEASVAIRVGNTPPVAQPDDASTAKNTPVTVDVLSNDTDLDGDALSVAAVGSPAHGTSALNANGTVTYTPNPGFIGDDTFTYTLADGQGGGDTGTVTVHIRESNAAPVLAAIGARSVIRGTELTFTATASDADPGQTLSFSLDAGAPAGTTIDPTTGTFRWLPGIDVAPGAYTVTVRVTDNGTMPLSATQTVTIHVLKLGPVAVSELTTPMPGPMQVAVDFNEAVTASSAQRIDNYRIARDDSPGLPIQSAVYTDNGNQHRVVLTVTAGTAVIPDVYHVYIDAANLTATNGDQGAPKADQLWVDVTNENTLKPITAQPDGSFAVSGNTQFLGYAPPQQIVTGDFTGDGITDLVVLTNGLTTSDAITGVDSREPITLLRGNGDGTFAPPAPIALGGTFNAMYITTVDWDHDGSPDLVAGGYAPNSSGTADFLYYVLLNDGNGHFSNAPETPIPVPKVSSRDPLLSPTAIYDLSGNGQYDILHPGYDSTTDSYGNLEVIGKDPFVGYTPQMELSLGLTGPGPVGPADIAFADLNADGKPDIITRNSGFYAANPGVSVVLSTPTGYAPGQQILHPLNPASGMGVGPFTGAGHKDIAVVYDNYRNSADVADGDVFQVLQNDGMGNFTALDPILLHRRDVASASFGDVNNDGIPDVVLVLTPGDGNFGGNTFDHVSQLSVWTLLGDGHGGFTPSTQAPLPLACTDQSAPSSMSLADLDGDGFPDLVLGSNQSAEVRLAINDGSASMRPLAHDLPFLGTPIFTARFYSPGVSEQAFADFNNDGLTDFVTTSPTGLDVYLGQSDGTVRHVQILTNPFATPLDWLKIGDLNNDGIPDLVCGNTSFSAGMAVFLGNGDGTFRPAPIVHPAGYDIVNATLADVNRDGKLDAIVTLADTQSGKYSYAVCFGDGHGNLTFNANTIVPIQGPLGAPLAATLGDFNGDGKLDLLVPTADNSDGRWRLTVYFANGNGTFTPGPVVYSGAVFPDTQILVGDVNGDGKLDLVAYAASALANGGKPTASVYLGVGIGTFQLAATVDLSIGESINGHFILPSEIALGDFNGDGKLDLAVSYFDFYVIPSVVNVYTGDATGNFAAPQSVTVGANPFTLVSIPRAPFLDAGSFAVTDHAPVANDDAATVYAGSSVSIPVLSNDTDTDHDPLTITQVTNPVHGVAHVTAGPPNNSADEAIVYAPATGFTGTDSFMYTIADPAGVESTATVTVTVTGFAAPVLQFSSATYSVNEGNGSVTITVSRSGITTGTLTVHYATGDGTAVAGLDYTATNGTLTFNSGDTSETLTVPILNDGQAEGNETINLVLSNPTGGAVLGTPATAVVTIVDSSSQPGQLQFSTSTYSVAESGGSATITVTRTGGSAGTVTVHYATSNGTALASTDYTSTNGTLTFNPGDTSETFTIPILNDGQTDGNETVNLTLSSPGGGATLGTPAAALLTIAETNGQPGQFQFGATAYQTLESSGSATITVTRTGGSDSTVTVQYTTGGGTAVAGKNYTPTSGTLTFNQGEMSHTFTIPIFNDGVVDGNQTVNVTLTSPGGGATLGTPTMAVLTIIDTNTPPPPPPPNPGGPTGDGTGHVQVVVVPLRKKVRGGPVKATITNIGNDSIQGPLYLVLTGLPKKIKVAGPTGVTKVYSPKSPYFALPAGQLNPGTSVTLTLRFRNAGKRNVKFVSKVIAGVAMV
jgi:hypothetical protein